MVRLLSAQGAFHARVVAARLGADGIPTELRGNVDGPYPMGEVQVYVPEDDLDAARDILLADEVESVFDEGAHDGSDERTPPALWVVLAAIVLLTCLALARAY